MEILKFYVSAHKADQLPESSVMDLYVSQAVEDLEEIPSDQLPAVCKAARLGAHGFIPGNAAILDVWHEFLRAAHKATQDLTSYYRAEPPPPPPTPEQAAQTAAMFDNLKKKFSTDEKKP